MSQRPETPFDTIEDALEYTHLLLEAAQEAHTQVEADIARIKDPKLARQKEAMRLASHKLTTLLSHLAKSKRILNDLRTLRRLLLEERKAAGAASSH